MRWLCRMFLEIRNDSDEVIDESVYVNGYPRAPSLDPDVGRVASFELAVVCDGETRLGTTKMCKSIAVFVVKDLGARLVRHSSV